MINAMTVNQVYLVSGVTDMRKAINGLSIIVSEQLGGNPFSGSVYVFCNRQRDKLKILYWERNGFWLYYRSLEQGKFQWPRACPMSEASALGKACPMSEASALGKACPMSEASALGMEKYPQTYGLTLRELQWLLDGLSFTQKRAHKVVNGLCTN